MATEPEGRWDSVLTVLTALLLFAGYVALFIWIPADYGFILLLLFVVVLVKALWVRWPNPPDNDGKRS